MGGLVAASRIRTDLPHCARIWNFWAGGKDYYEIDSVIGAECLARYPGISAMARDGQRFGARAVEFLAAAGIRQFLDLGCGLPGPVNVHEIAQKVDPAARIVYVDNDPLVLTHARALMKPTTPEGVVGYVDADIHDPERVIAEAKLVLDFDEPLAVLGMCTLGYARTSGEAQRIIATLRDAVPAGSYLAAWDGAAVDPGFVDMWGYYAGTGAAPYEPRSRRELEAVFEGWTLVEPGFAPVPGWRPAELVGPRRIREAAGYCGVARKR
ncbi:SAM-dependent methyltransferase [Nocardia sp. NPDC050712]|uniref:SAM-dependent methyltransferase n=1 Tax=Nocardia sp. NPDC050712 TaxID=3155518 RepID=UPI0034056EE2